MWMKFAFLFLASVLASCSATYFSGGKESDLPPPSVVKDQYIVTAKGDLCEFPTPVKECRLIRAGETYDVRDFSRVSLLSLEGAEPSKVVPYSKEEDRCLTDLSGFKCEPNYVMELYGNDPLLSQQWGIESIGGYDAWKVIKEAPDVLVAVVDSGSNCEHEDLGCVAEYNATNNRDGKGAAFDENGHGTHVHGTVAAIGGNGQGVAGAVWRSNVAAYKFLDASGVGSTLTAVRAIDHAIERGVDIINCSFGSRGYSAALADSVARAQEEGIIIVAASGNSGLNTDDVPHYPSNYPGVVSVGSIGRDRSLSSFSNYGKETVSVLAPGDGIISTWPPSSYKILRGTSMAAPHVTGVLAGLLQQRQDLPKKERAAWAIKRLFDTAQQEIPGKSKFGTINYGAAVGYSEPCRRNRCVKCRKGCKKKFECRCGKQRKCMDECLKEHGCEKGCQ